MKKLAFLLLTGILVISLAACGRKADEMTPTTNQPETTQQTNEENVPDPTVNNNSTENNSSGNGAVGDVVENMVPDTTDNSTGVTEGK